MAKPPSPLLRYIGEVYRHGEFVAGSLVVNGLLWVLNLWAPDWWESPAPWVYILVFVIGLFVAQFLAWLGVSKERDRLTADRDSVKRKAERLEEEIDRLQTSGVMSLTREFKKPARHLMGRGNRTPLLINAFLDALAYVIPVDRNGERMAASYHRRTFAVLRVRNGSGKNLAGVVAQCSVVPSAQEVRSIWSKESGEEFVLGGSHAADLNAGDFRLLVFAQAIGTERLWLRLPGMVPIHEVPAEGRSKEEGLRYISRRGEVLNLGSALEVSVAFKAEGVSQPERFRLGFDQEGNPTIEHIPSGPAKPPITPPPSSPPPSPPESSG